MTLSGHCDAGGRIVAQGTPEQVAANPESYTGQFLAQHFTRRRGGTKPASGAKGKKRAEAAE